MGWFSRKRHGRFPADMMARLEMMGRFQLDPARSDVDPTELSFRCFLPFYDDAVQDPEGFLADLRAFVADDDGGFATYGAARLTTECLGLDCRLPDALALIDGGIAFKRDRGFPLESLAMFELQRWRETHGDERW